MYSLTTTCTGLGGGSIAVLTQAMGIYHRAFIDNIKSIPSTSAGISSTLGNTRIRYKSSWFTDHVRVVIVFCYTADYTIPPQPVLVHR